MSRGAGTGAAPRAAVPIAGGRFAVIGGGSMIGTAIVRELLEAGAAEVLLADVFAFGRSERAAALAARERVREVELDVTRPEQILEALEGVDGVFHVAALLTSQLSSDPGRGVDVNVKGTSSVLDACRSSGVAKLVLSSTVGVYGSSVGRLTEEAPFTGSGMHPATALYALSKLASEELCAISAAAGGPAWISLRYSTVYGPGQHRRGLNSAMLLEAYDRIEAGEVPTLPGPGDDGHDYVFVEDVARANLAAMEAPVGGERLTIATGVASTTLEAVAALSRACGGSGEVEPGPSGAGPAFSPGEVAYVTEKAERLLGWRAEVDLDRGMELLVEHLRGGREPILDSAPG